MLPRHIPRQKLAYQLEKPIRLSRLSWTRNRDDIGRVKGQLDLSFNNTRKCPHLLIGKNPTEIFITHAVLTENNNLLKLF
jgi:hypothetical protein